MRSRNLTNGVLLIAVGLYFLLQNLGVSPVLPWANLLQLWPLFIVVFGLQLLFPNGVLSALAPLLLILTLAVGLFGNPLDRSVDTQKTTLPVQNGIQSGELKLQRVPVASLQILMQVPSSTDALQSSTSAAMGGRWRTDFDGETSTYLFRCGDSSRTTVFSPRNRAMELALSSELAWDLHLDVAVLQGVLDLRGLTWEQLYVESGVSHLTLIFGEGAEDAQHVRIDSGITRVVLQVPRLQELSIATSTPAFLHNLADMGLQQRGGRYVTSNYDRGDHPSLDIVIESGIALVVLEWIE